MKLHPVLCSLLLLSTTAMRVSAACDPTTIEGVSYDTDADSAVFNGPDHWGKEGFDFPNGRFFGTGHGLFGRGGSFMNVKGSDVYFLEGAPGGPFLIHAELQIQVQMGNLPPPDCGICNSHAGEFKATLYDSKGGGDSTEVCLCWNTTQTIGLDLSVLNLEEFRLSCGIAGFEVGSDIANIEARIRFTGVPPLARLSSCHGVNEQAVPTKSTSWGRVKATYR
jgi:hypothetical protein